jgi:hypothetical protein
MEKLFRLPPMQLHVRPPASPNRQSESFPGPSIANNLCYQNRFSGPPAKLLAITLSLARCGFRIIALYAPDNSNYRLRLNCSPESVLPGVSGDSGQAGGAMADSGNGTTIT